jgi:hypothetical protein
MSVRRLGASLGVPHELEQRHDENDYGDRHPHAQVVDRETAAVREQECASCAQPHLRVGIPTYGRKSSSNLKIAAERVGAPETLPPRGPDVSFPG